MNIMHKVKAERSGELFVKNMLILQHHWTWADWHRKKNSRNFQKDWNKFPEISELTTLCLTHTMLCYCSMNYGPLSH